MKISRYIRRIKNLLRKGIYKTRFGSNLKIEGIPGIRKNTEIVLAQKGRIFIGKGFVAQENTFLKASGGELTVGSRVSLNRNCMIVCHQKIQIEDDCIFGPGVTIYDHDHIFGATGVSKTTYKTGEVVIGKGCWIASNVVILRNTHIGEGSVIGAGAVVKGDIPPHSLVTSDRTLCVRPIRNSENW